MPKNSSSRGPSPSPGVRSAAGGRADVNGPCGMTTLLRAGIPSSASWSRVACECAMTRSEAATRRLRAPRSSSNTGVTGSTLCAVQTSRRPSGRSIRSQNANQAAEARLAKADLGDAGRANA